MRSPCIAVLTTTLVAATAAAPAFAAPDPVPLSAPGPPPDLRLAPPPPSRCTLGFTSPGRDAVLYGPTTIVADPACPEGVEPVSILYEVDNRAVGLATAPPWSVTFDAGSSFGPHVLRATLEDGAGRRATAIVATPGAAVRESVRVAAKPPDQVTLSVAVTGRDGRPIRGLDRDDFVVEEAGRPVRLDEARPDDRPLSLVVLIDVSSSVASCWEVLREAAPSMARALRPQDALRIVAFSGPACLVQDFTSDPKQVERAMRRFDDWGGGTSLYDTLAAVGTEMAWTRDGRQAVILVTDGIDTLSRIDPARLREYLQRTTLVIETLLLRSGSGAVGPRRALAKLTRETGGSLTRVSTPAEMGDALAALGARLQDRYYLAWRSDQAARGGWRSITVEVPGRKAVVATRKGIINQRPIGEFLIEDLAKAEPEGRRKAAEWLGNLPVEGAGEALLAALLDRDARVRTAAAASLGRLREPRGIDALIEMMDASPGDRAAADTGLRVYGPAAVPALLEALRAAPPDRQSWIMAILMDIGDGRAVDALMALAQPPAPPANTPGRAASESSARDRRALHDRRLTAIQALGSFRTSAVLPLLEKAAGDRDPEVRRTALSALGQQATPAACAVLERLARAADRASTHTSPGASPDASSSPPPGTSAAPDPPGDAARIEAIAAAGDARSVLIGALREITAKGHLGEWLQDPVAMNIYLFALRDASLDSHGPWWPVIEAVGGLDAALQRLDALGTVLPEKPARMVRHTAVRLRHLIGSAGSHGEP